MSKKFEFKFSLSLPAKPMSRQEMAALLDFYIAQLQEARAAVLSGDITNFLVRLGMPKKKPIGREARRKIADAQRARWAKLKGSIVPQPEDLLIVAQPEDLLEGQSANLAAAGQS